MQSESWRKEKMYGEKDAVLWAILTGKGIENIRVVGSALREEDADAIIADHNAASALRAALIEAQAALEGADKVLEWAGDLAQYASVNPDNFFTAWAKYRAEHGGVRSQLAALHTPTGAGTTEAN